MFPQSLPPDEGPPHEIPWSSGVSIGLLRILEVAEVINRAGLAVIILHEATVEIKAGDVVCEERTRGVEGVQRDWMNEAYFFWTSFEETSNAENIWLFY